jgi:protein phosphatase
MMDELVCFGVTDRGLKRENNQDAFFIGRLSKSILVGANSLDLTVDSRLFGEIRGYLMLVADGMGGHAGGAKASRMAIDFLIDRLLNNVHWFLRFSPEAEADFVKSLQALLVETHHQIQAEGRRDQSVSGMGTTLTMTYTVWPNLYVLHAGDSRCYLIRDGYVEQLTNDHTMARRLVEAGGIHPKDAVNSRWSNVLWNVLGGKSQEEIQAEVRQVKLHPGDRLMLCTDGLHRYVDNDVILKTLDDCESCEEACRLFVRIANDAGGEDNITVIVAQFADDFSRQGEDPQRQVDVRPTDALLPATDVSLPATDRPSH